MIARPVSRFKPPAAVLLIELVQHAAPLCPGHAGLDLRERSLGARQDRGMVGERYAKRVGSRRDVAPVSPCRSGHRPGLHRLTLPRRHRAGRIASHGYATVRMSAHGREIERRDVIHHRTGQWRDGCVHQNTPTASRRRPTVIRSRAFFWTRF